MYLVEGVHRLSLVTGLRAAIPMRSLTGASVDHRSALRLRIFEER